MSETPKIPAHTWLTIAGIAAGFAMNWGLMRDHVSELRADVAELQSEVEHLKIRAATEDAADQLLDLRVERLEEMPKLKY